MSGQSGLEIILQTPEYTCVFCLVQSAAWKIYSYVIIQNIILVLLCELSVIYSHSIYL